MDINKKNRSDLKSYFVKNSIPTESNFADLIDATLNQKDDGIVKLPGDPLSIEAAGDVAGLLKVVNFYAKFQDNNPAWSLQLNPRTDPNTLNTAKPGFAVVDGSGATRLFIDKASGNLGIGTMTPQAKLTVVGTANISDGKSPNLPTNSMVSGSLTMGSITANYGGGQGWQASSGVSTVGLLLETLSKTEIGVHHSTGRLDSLMYYEGDAVKTITIGRDMGWGSTPVTIAGNLTVNGGVGNVDSKMQSVGQLVIKGSSPQIDFVDTDNNDWAIHVNSNRMHFIREPWNVDNLVLFGNGNVAIGPGSGDPTEKLEVNGRIKAGALTVGPWPADTRYVFFGANTLDQAIAANYALLQSVSGNDTGETYLNSPKAIHLRIGNAEKMAINSDSSVIYNNLGIGVTTAPIAKLDIAQATRSGAHPAAVKGLYITGNFGFDADGVEFRHSDGKQGIGFGYNTIYAAGSNADQDLQLKAKGKGVMRVLGAANISNGAGFANGNNFMSSGSLTIGSTNASYGGGNNWSANTAGLLLETLANTEIAVHDSNNRLSSLMYYEGDATNRITIGRDMAWGTTPVNIAGNITLNGNVALGGFTGADVDEWPKVTWYRDTPNNWDEGLIKHASNKGFFGRTGFGIHLHASRDWTFFSTNWTPLLGIEGGTGNTKIRGALTIGDQTVASGISGGLLALKGPSPQIDFIDSDNNDWSIHVNSNKMYFIREPWSFTDLVLDGAGHVGIGTDNPTQAKLVVLGSAALPLNGYGYLNRHGASATNTTFTSPYSIFADQRIAASEFNAHSDARIKNVQSRSDSATDLQTLLGIEITDYLYKDVIGKGDASHKKVIAQQVERVFPQAVNKHTDVIPDIYQQAALVDGWVELATDLKQGERVRLISDKTEGVHEVLEVGKDKFRTDFKPEGDTVFVFGREVNDFGNVDYDAISMLNVSATQQLKKEMDALKAENAALNARLEALEAKIH